ncbi:hypothetical protein GCM10009347_13960 [Shewanella algicola]|uniref:Cysteine-rich CWC family protein n=1 Tax=Shewanella algicola TaxID=640633 RepID=A0A9X1ZAR5_9GAMM|nr:cysteine-rich CWC family protein [Shewanella algicola]MCL1105020.1 cysteine-rich CWC family protein [Shewanella algicola]GGP47976.1 hypothetical protein GCM10009347_13960 [Shewanella algicola]
MTLLTSAQQCPLCQHPNACAISQGLDINACWCAKQTLDKPSVIRQLNTANLMADLPDNQCICQQCIEKILAAMTINAVQQYRPGDH